MKTSDLEMALGELALPLERGDTAREICPKCGGGQSREKSLGIGVSEEGYLWWKCHRASCGFKGRRLMWGVVEEYHSKPKKQGRTFTGALEPLSGMQKELIQETFGMEVPHNWRYAPEYQRIYMPILSPKLEHRGCILRNFPSSALTPKTLTFKENFDLPWQHWFPLDNGLIPVIVEDMFSAAKVQQCGIPSICLLGTHLSLDKVREIVSYYDSAVLALDKDAFEKAVGYAGTFRSLVGLSVWRLEKDLKFVSPERIQAAYFNNKVNFNV